MGAAALACVGCPVGQRHAEALSLDDAKPDSKRGVSRWDSRPSGQCVRCGRRVLRLVLGHTLCPSCYNRQREFLHGRNSKGGTPQKWAGLRQAHVEIDLHGKQQRLDIGLRSGRPEIERFVARRWPEAIVTRVWLDAEPPAVVPAHCPVGTACSTARFAATPEMAR
ncbi:hypothetical protein [Paraburkholderia elongata]|uniref:Uncharacterized protein n=1 Tax=Paraburkholderia elongata TaxID=2675747 RepID=A0A972NV86_9BURK|nr:hypothetical protein [Paraburkholderia elongata]NPT60336.1 hypothetical protein [Paraburkholderia elongata]